MSKKTSDAISIIKTFEHFDRYDNKISCSIEDNGGSGDQSAPESYCNFFEKHGYLLIRNLVDPEELFSRVPDYCPETDDPQVPGSVRRYDNPKYKEIHNKIRFILEKVLQKKLYNTYYYERFYFAGQELEPHVDREACEISVTIQASTNRFKPWSFFIQSKTGENHYVDLQDGWAVLYKGIERPHWRNKLKSRYSKLGRIINRFILKKDDTYHHQIFFHYVLADGEYSHFAFDASTRI